MAESPGKFHDKIKALQKAYAAELLVKNKRICEILDALKSGSGDAALLKDLHRIVHNMAGAGASLGFSSLSRIARDVDNFLKPVIQGGGMPTPEQMEHLGSAIHALSRALENPGLREDVFAEAPEARQEPQADKESKALIFVVEDDINLARIMALHLRQFGYEVEMFHEPEGVLKAIRERVPSVIVMDVIFPGNDRQGFETIAAIRRTVELPVPVVFVSVRDDFSARLEAVRMGGHAYFNKPVDIIELVEVLDTITLHYLPEPYRILVIDDEPRLADYYSILLKGADMRPEVVTEPTKVLQTLGDFNPDLIVMDIYMPECSGLELAAVIRQISTFDSVPIVFLSVETDIRKQLDAMRLGGDDFLTKPIEPDRLTSLVRSRAQRARILRSYMTCDSLTGLLNHSTTKLRLDAEIARAKRQSSRISLGLIDIDNFKQVNDTFGHYVGDQVIKSLSRLLMQRLRKTDIIGRYGGEEFAVILPETDGSTALKVMDEIRATFLDMGQQKSEERFVVSFSCGISCFPEAGDSTALINSADTALYEAKRSGRNRVVLAGK